MQPLVDYTNRTTGKAEKVLLGRHGVIQILDKDNRAIKKMDVPQGAHLILGEGDIGQQRRPCLSMGSLQHSDTDRVRRKSAMG